MLPVFWVSMLLSSFLISSLILSTYYLCLILYNSSIATFLEIDETISTDIQIQ